MFFNKTKYLVAVYLRLSIADGDLGKEGKDESNSIENQRQLIKGYMSGKPFLQFVKEYVDDGYSGSSFERPGFIKMMEDVEKGKINCIIVKDLSRFGRNYIEVGRYLERKFPAMGIRFIAINDDYDNAKESGDANEIIVPFKNLINDTYCRDISIKVRSQLDVKRKNGKFIGSFAAYGYLKDPSDKNHLIVDEYAAQIVRQIYNLKLDGLSVMSIANKLNSMAIPPPMEYKRMRGLNFNSGFRTTTDQKWGAKSVIRILENELYTGVMVQGKNRKINYKIKKSRPVSPDKWIRVQNTHEPIISTNIFERMQEIMRLDTRTAPEKQSVYLLSGLVKCGACGQNMIRRSTTKNGRTYYYLHCSSYRNKEGCTSHIISEGRLIELVVEYVKERLALLFEADSVIKSRGEAQSEQLGVMKINSRLDELEKEYSRYCDLKERLYRDMTESVIDREEYTEYNNRFSAKIEEIKRSQKALEEKKRRLLSTDIRLRPWMKEFKKIGALEALGRKEIVILVSRIVVFGKEKVEIHLNYEDEISELIRRAGLATGQEEL